MDKFKKAVWQVPAMILLAAVIGIAVNHFRADGIALKQNWQAGQIPANAAYHMISINQAAALYRTGKAVFIDARPAAEYQAGHIKGAVSLPFEQAETVFITVVQKIPENATIITYCDGPACDLSRDLAKFLAQIGFVNVDVLLNGWTLWNEHGLPVSGAGS